MSELLNEEEELLKSLEKYYTSRIDIRNFGNEDNTIEIITKSDLDAKIKFPKWMESEKGKGMSIESNKLSIDLKIKCINDGKLKIFFRSQDIKDKENNRFPVYIDYTSLIINKKEYITENQLTWFDDSFTITKDVKDNELITIHAEWMPFTKSSLYENKKLIKLEKEFEKLTNNFNKTNEKIEELKSKNKKLKNKISNSSIRELRKIQKEL